MATSGATILNKSITFWRTFEGAAKIANANSRDDDNGETEYRVEEIQPGKFAIGVYDRDDGFMLYL